MAKFKHKLSHSQKQKRPKNKAAKTELIFDEKKREEYLTGFSKRKKERQKKAQADIIDRLKEEKRQIKKKKREELDSKWKALDLATSLDDVVAVETIDLPKHTVTVTDVATVDFVGSSGHMLGNNQGLYESDSEKEEEEKQEHTDPAKKLRPAKKHGYAPRGPNSKHKNLTHLMTKQHKARAKKHKQAAIKAGKIKVKRKRNANNK